MGRDYKHELGLWLSNEYGDMVIPEHRFHVPQDGEKKRMWRFDYALLAERVGIEFDGVVSHSAHTSISNVLSDSAKFNTAALQGWLVIRTNTPNLRDGTGYEAIMRAVEIRRSNAA